jgi:shikimate dehydrogenase
MDPESRLTRLALFGAPVRHSLSPRIHALFAGQGGLAVEYTAVESSVAHLARDIRRLVKGGGRGCNITLPLKHEAFGLATRTSERARRARAVNTLSFANPSRWEGDNTDGVGLVRDILDNLGLQLTGRRICILGAGGAAAGVLYDLLSHTPAAISIYNRTPARAMELAGQHSDLGNISHAQSHDPSAARPFDLVINATSAGHQSQLPVISPALFAPKAACYDLNYGRFHAVLRDWCREHAIPCHDGLGMLVEQAAESFRIWTGFTPDTGPVIEGLRGELGN